MRPDCADMPYFLRAYFAFKMGLPFGFTKCSRGGGGSPPKCYEWMNIISATAQQPGQGLGQAFGRYLRVVSDDRQSGAGRTLWNDENTNFYPVALSQETLHPGTIFADPYGHILMIVQHMPRQGGAAGICLRPTPSPISRSRASGSGAATSSLCTIRRTAIAPASADCSPDRAGRPMAVSAGSAMPGVARNPDYGDFSLEQAQL